MPAASRPRRGSRALVPLVLLGVVTLGTGLAAWLSVRTSGSVGASVGPEGVLVYDVTDLAPSATTLTGAPVDGITCRPSSEEQVTYHVHVLVDVYVNGQLRRLPAGIGITRPRLVERYSSGVYDDVGTSDCLYWLHTHVADGVIHVEAPHRGVFTLGEFFDVWHQPLSYDQVGPARGAVTVFENGHRLAGDPRLTPLRAHAVIQIDVGAPVVAFQPRTFTVSGGCGEGTNGCSSKP